jgi:hypothetical protein
MDINAFLSLIYVDAIREAGNLGLSLEASEDYAINRVDCEINPNCPRAEIVVDPVTGKATLTIDGEPYINEPDPHLFEENWV